MIRFPAPGSPAPARILVVTAALAVATALPAGGAEPVETGAAAAEHVFDGLEAAGFTLLATGTVDGVDEAEVVYDSDGLAVRGFVFAPRERGLYPLVVFNHGGMSGVSADMKWRSRQLVERGAVVITPTYRGEGGSEGRIEVARGEVDDVLHAATLLSGWERVDPSRVALVGSSHGALVSMLAAAREPDRFAGVAAACGVMDIVSWYHYLVAAGFDVGDSLSRAVYGDGPEDRPEAFAVRRAVPRARDIRIPVLLQQGLADRIVPPFQARAMLDALRRAGHPDAALLEYPELGHAFWFWNDLRHHPQEELAEAERAWGDLLGFLDRVIGLQSR